jgi:hypothetical protein
VRSVAWQSLQKYRSALATKSKGDPTARRRYSLHGVKSTSQLLQQPRGGTLRDLPYAGPGSLDAQTLASTTLTPLQSVPSTLRHAIHPQSTIKTCWDGAQVRSCPLLHAVAPVGTPFVTLIPSLH